MLSIGNFPDNMKLAEITPVKLFYLSILSTISKIFERLMQKQIVGYKENLLSSYLCGYRKNFNTEQCC